MTTNDETGIEISPGTSRAQQLTDEILHALHMDWFGVMVKKLGAGATMGIRVDGGVRREDPWSGSHFVACAPGVHRVELDWNTHSIGGRSLTPLRFEVTVDPGCVTRVEYTVQQLSTHGPAAASFRILGTRRA